MSKVKIYPYPNSEGIPEELYIDINKPSHQGGEGKIYFTADNRYTIKIHHSQSSNLNEKKIYLEQIVLLNKNLDSEAKNLFCWPISTVRSVDGNPSLGCVTRRIPQSYVKLIDLVFNARLAIRQFRDGHSWANYLQIAKIIARSAEKLSFLGCTHTDFSFNNFLASIEPVDAILIDLDSLVVPGFWKPKVTGTPGFMAPEITIDPTKNPPNEYSDRYALAINILYTLLFRNPMKPLICHDPTSPENDEKIGWGKEAVFSEHPIDKRNHPANLGKPLFYGGTLSYKMLTLPLQRLTEQAFIDGLFKPERRPSARAWINALSWAMDELWQCANCKLHFPYPHWLKKSDRLCPFCGNHITQDVLSLLYLYEPRPEGQYAFTQRSLVMTKGWHLYSDILDPTRNPPISRKTEPKVGHIEWDDKRRINLLLNNDKNTWMARTNSSQTTLNIHRGESIPLTPGTVIRFGDGQRLLVVAE